MAAAFTVPQLSPSLNSTDASEPLRPSRGVLTLAGFRISLRLNAGHLIVEDGIGAPRRRARFARVGHGLRRVVIIGSDGVISLAAIRWLADQDVSLTMIDREGRVLFAVGPTGIRETRIRRAQARAHDTGIAMPIIRELIDRKLAGQERVARDLLHDAATAIAIAGEREAVCAALTPDAVRNAEARGALSYWAAWHQVPVNFPRADLPRVPEHWRSFGARRSPLTGSPRRAVTPPCAILNYLYALAEAEARRAAVTLGLDPGCGFLHSDADARDSLACDLMEVVRPTVDAYVLSWLRREPLRREWFFE